MKHMLTLLPLTALLLATSAMADVTTNLAYRFNTEWDTATNVKIVPWDYTINVPTLNVATNDLIWKYGEDKDVYFYGNFPGKIHVGDKTYRVVTVTNITVELKEVK